jgi:uncharacterized protein YggT (Ycf19 family)
MIPISGGIDFAPLVVLFGVYAIEILIRNNMY